MVPVLKICMEVVDHHKQQGEGKENVPDPEEESEDVEGREDTGEGLVGTAAALPSPQVLRMSIHAVRRAGRPRVKGCCQ